MTLWLNQHALALRLVLGRLKQHWLNTLSICLVIGITATLPGLLFVVLDNLQDVTRGLKQDAQVSVFLKADVNSNSIQRLINDIRQLPQVQIVRFVPKEEALSTLSAQFSQKDLLADLPHNPLPDALFITLADSQPASLQAVQEALQGRSEVEEVLVDKVWIERLHHMLTLGKRIALIFTCLLAASMMTVISNTVRMQVLTHEAEIEVSRLIGATHSFIRRPFLYMGLLYGVAGGLIAIALLTSILFLIRQPVLELALNYQSDFQPGLDVLRIGSMLLLLTGSIGWVAAFTAMSRQK